jgi:hypothetical protein
MPHGQHDQTKKTSFDPFFDDTKWTRIALNLDIRQVPPRESLSGYAVRKSFISKATIFDKDYSFCSPFECRFLYSADGKLWMSDVPQERIMMYNNAKETFGNVLVGGLGLGLYPQLAEMGKVGNARNFCIVEIDGEIINLVEPFLYDALRVPFTLIHNDVESFLSENTTTRFDTIFLDTWNTIDPTNLPRINKLRKMADKHLAEKGKILLWGYRWMLRLFEEACIQLLQIGDPRKRYSWFVTRSFSRPMAADLLTPVAKYFDSTECPDIAQALGWCDRYITELAW